MTPVKPAIQYAVIAFGGAQHLVHVGQPVQLPTMPDAVGANVTFDQVLLVTEPTVQIGQPVLTGATVTGTVVSHGRTAKVTGVKFHNKVRYRRTFGHRQGFTTVKIDAINTK